MFDTSAAVCKIFSVELDDKRGSLIETQQQLLRNVFVKVESQFDGKLSGLGKQLDDISKSKAELLVAQGGLKADINQLNEKLVYMYIYIYIYIYIYVYIYTCIYNNAAVLLLCHLHQNEGEQVINKL